MFNLFLAIRKLFTQIYSSLLRIISWIYYQILLQIWTKFFFFFNRKFYLAVLIYIIAILGLKLFQQILINRVYHYNAIKEEIELDNIKKEIQVYQYSLKLCKKGICISNNVSSLDIKFLPKKSFIQKSKIRFYKFIIKYFY